MTDTMTTIVLVSAALLLIGFALLLMSTAKEPPSRYQQTKDVCATPAAAGRKLQAIRWPEDAPRKAIDHRDPHVTVKK